MEHRIFPFFAYCLLPIGLFTERFRTWVLRGTAPFDALGNDRSEGDGGNENKGKIGFDRHHVHVVERGLAMGIDVFRLYQSPGKRPGGFFVYGVVGYGIAVVFRNDLGGAAALVKK
jgi:hypothetical protein